jgi:hypothetical protein
MAMQMVVPNRKRRCSTRPSQVPTRTRHHQHVPVLVGEPLRARSKISSSESPDKKTLLNNFPALVVLPNSVHLQPVIQADH